MDIIREDLKLKEIKNSIEKSLKVEQNYIIPDIKSDIIKSILVNGNVFISKTEIQSNKIKVEGNLNIYNLYLDNDENNSNIDIVIPFSDYIKIDEEVENPEDIDVRIDATIKNIDIKILNERKIDVISDILFMINLVNNNSTQIITDISNDDDIIEKKTNAEIFESLVESKRNSGRIKENLKLTDVERIVGIVNMNYNILNVENKISYNKVLVKAEIEIETLYRNEENKLSKKTNTVQFMTFIDVADVKESNYCKTEIKILSSNINLISNNSIDIELECEAICDIYETKEINYISDFYGIKKSYSFDTRNINYSNKEDSINAIKHSINEKILIDNINNLYDTKLYCLVQNRVYQDGKTTFLCTCKIIYVYDLFDGKNIETVEKNIDFEIEINGNIENILLDIENSNFTILPDSTIDSRIDIIAKNKEIEKQTISLINNIVENEKETNEYSLIIYYVQEDDDMWKIAKKFQTTIENINRINNIKSTETIENGRRLYIPRAI